MLATVAPAGSTQSITLFEWNRQQELETSGLEQGAARFHAILARSAAAGEPASIGAARKLVLEGLRSTTDAISARIGTKRPGAGRALAAARWCEAIGIETAAYLTLRTALSHLLSGNPVTFTVVAVAVADSILDELRYRRFREQSPQLFNYALRAANRQRISSQKASALRERTEATVDCSDLALDDRAKLLFGSQLTDCMMSTVDWCDAGYIDSDKKKRRTQTLVLALKADAQEAIRADNELLAALSLVGLPMVIPPLPWRPKRPGGYWFALRHKFPLVRGRTLAADRRVNKAQINPVYEAVNHIQSIPWVVNRWALSVVKEFLALGGGIAGLPTTTDESIPVQPPGEPDGPVLEAWRREAAEVYRRNDSRRTKVAEVARIVAVAEMYQDDLAVYFPHSIDFRGRVYPIVAQWHPQGRDLSRALLTFRDAQPLDETGVRWLAITGANLMGRTVESGRLSRLSLDERASWVYANEHRILRTAADPLGIAGFWLDAESPLQFLAWCHEWAAFASARDRGVPYSSSFPCHMDATASGLQVYSALLRDDEGGAAVNLVSSDRPADVYEMVADRVRNELAVSAGQDPLAQAWLDSGLVTRRLTKLPTMTWPYSAQRWGFKNQIYESLREAELQELSRQLAAVGATAGKACLFLAGVISKVLPLVVRSAHEGMLFFQGAARGIAAANRPVEWTMPITGFPVLQTYYVPVAKKTQTTLCGHFVSPTVLEDSARIDARKTRSAIGPNLIHSLDAAHLHLSVCAAAREGIPLATVHDSFATVPSRCDRLATIIREQFVELYQQDVLGSIHAQLAEQWPDPRQCPDPPETGTLDITAVLDSPYFSS